MCKADFGQASGSLISLANDGYRTQIVTTVESNISESSQSSDKDSNSKDRTCTESRQWPLINIFELFDSHPTLRLLRDPTDELDLYTCKLGANVPDILVSTIMCYLCPEQLLTSN